MHRGDNLINGEWIRGASYAPNINPSNVADTIGEFAHAGAADVDAAVMAATAAFPAWSAGNIQARA
ncbi:MAG TPA: aldehyde dehydrogenase family protein, partial [Gemmatimonadaceae bacterium]